MIWHDLAFDRVIDAHALAEGIASVFGVQPDDVRIVNVQDTDAIIDSGDAPVLLELNPRLGQFAFGFSVILRSPETERAVATAAQSEAIIARLCARWQAHCLFDDGTVNPYGYVRMHPSGRVDHVTLDAAALDERDEYTVASSRPRTPPITPSAIG